MGNTINIHLSTENRVEVVEIPAGANKIELEVSRTDCKDVLLEIIDQDGKAKGKPLSKYTSALKGKSISKMRFMMNDFSTRPVTVTIKLK